MEWLVLGVMTVVLGLAIKRIRELDDRVEYLEQRERKRR